MSTPPPIGNKDFERLGALARESFPDDLSEREQANASRLADRLPPPSRRRVAYGLGLGLVVTAAIVFLITRPPAIPPLRFQLVEHGSSPQRVEQFEFSDGSRVSMAASAHAQVTRIGPHGASVRLESGRLSTQFKPLAHAEWTIAAGPYLVLVTGTAFDVDWSPTTQALELWLHHGSVQLKGPTVGADLTVRAGQHVVAKAATGQLLLDAIAPALPEPRPTETPHADEPVAKTPPDHANRRAKHLPDSRLPSQSTPSTPSPRWPELLAKGDLARIVDEAEQMGIPWALATSSAPDLAALADAARYARKNDLAKQALLTERQRFPASTAGKDAAFFLGGLEESRPGGEGQRPALDWYQRYVRENPRGGYSGQALGRTMLLLETLRDATASRQAAKTYLSHSPNGPYAAKARRLAEQP